MYPTIDREWVAIIGSREYPNLNLVSLYIKTLPRTTVIVTGSWWKTTRMEATRGVDYAAAMTAEKAGMIVILVAGSRRDGYLAGKKRNSEIIRRSSRVVAFWDGKSPGTMGGIELAKEFMVPCRVITPETNPADL